MCSLLYVVCYFVLVPSTSDWVVFRVGCLVASIWILMTCVRMDSLCGRVRDWDGSREVGVVDPAQTHHRIIIPTIPTFSDLFFNCPTQITGKTE